MPILMMATQSNHGTCDATAEAEQVSLSPSDVARLLQTVRSFAGRVAKSKDPQVSNALHQFQREFKRIERRVGRLPSLVSGNK
jgi:hypothetical protein